MDKLLHALGDARARCARLPFVTAAYARSADGFLSRARGQRTWLSGPEAAELTHRLRAVHDALVVGVETVLVDDPQLTTRLVPGPSPLRVVLDSHLRTPPSARLLDEPATPPWIVCGNDAPGDRASALERAGARLCRLPALARRVDLRCLLARLADGGVRSVMVEGGAQVLTSFTEAGLLDFVCATIAPMQIGSERAVAGPATDPLTQPNLVSRQFCFGRDRVVAGPVRR